MSLLRLMETETVSKSFKTAEIDTVPLASKNVLPSGNVGEPLTDELLLYLKESRFINQTSLAIAWVGASTASVGFGEITEEAGGGSVR